MKQTLKEKKDQMRFAKLIATALEFRLNDVKAHHRAKSFLHFLFILIVGLSAFTVYEYIQILGRSVAEQIKTP